MAGDRAMGQISQQSERRMIEHAFGQRAAVVRDLLDVVLLGGVVSGLEHLAKQIVVALLPEHGVLVGPPRHEGDEVEVVEQFV